MESISLRRESLEDTDHTMLLEKMSAAKGAQDAHNYKIALIVKGVGERESRTLVVAQNTTESLHAFFHSEGMRSGKTTKISGKRLISFFEKCVCDHLGKFVLLDRLREGSISYISQHL